LLRLSCCAVRVGLLAWMRHRVRELTEDEPHDHQQNN
jgi:hypothetical protein